MDTTTPDTQPHGSIQTTTGTAEPAPEVLLTKGYAKRSLAAIETEFVDSCDVNGMAPSSAVLQADYLIMDDAHNLDERYDMAPKANAPDPPRDIRVTKRVRYSDDRKLTASDFSHLEPIITPKDEQPSIFSTSSSSSLGLYRKNSSSLSSSNSIPHTQSRKRSIADLVPPSSSQEPVYLDETRAINEYGEPVDTSAAGLAMDISGYGPGPMSKAHKVVEVSGMIKTKIMANSTNDTLRLKEPTSTASPAPSTASSTTSKSPLFIPPSHCSRPHLPHQDSSCSNNGSSDAKRTMPARKNSMQWPVRIQLLDEQESETLDQARRASADQLDEDDEEEEHHGVSHDTSNVVQKKKKTGPADDIALPPEDPIVHDWDKEELDDEDNDSNYGSEPNSVSSSPRRRDPVYRKRKSIEEDIRRAAGEDHPSHHYKQRHHLSNAIDNDDDDDDDDDDERHDFLHGDPERDIAVMSEDQEADLHN
ncbi:hypothetical protein CPB97_004148, partial [Podila verticillata]